MVLDGGELVAEIEVLNAVQIRVHQLRPVLRARRLPLSERRRECVRDLARKVLPDHPVVAVGYGPLISRVGVREVSRAHRLDVSHLGFRHKRVRAEEQDLKQQNRQCVLLFLLRAQEGAEAQPAAHAEARCRAGMREILEADRARISAELETVGVDRIHAAAVVQIDHEVARVDVAHQDVAAVQARQKLCRAARRAHEVRPRPLAHVRPALGGAADFEHRF